MTKLIGNNPNQVPSNADLGTAAFMDKKEFLLSKGSSLSAIDAVIPKTAVDVFIYDTSKDSDGGAWRKRTQHTSWYNERLNTTTRGSRRDFPSVAVIVLANGTGGGLSIYDGDDPGLPLWMHFENSGTGWNTSILPLNSGNNYLTSVSTKNGYIFIGSTNNSIGLMAISFIEDMTRSYLNANYGGIDTSPLVNRNTSGHTFSAGTGNNTLPPLVNIYINDLAVTVLPNAPIDPATGLPVPTIAVATDGGVSVIKDDGTVVDITSATFSSASQISFTRENQLSFYNNPHYSLAVQDIPTSDQTGLGAMYSNSEFRYSSYDVVGSPNLIGDAAAGNASCHTNTPEYGFSTGSGSGLTSIQRVPASPSKGLTNYITSTYNTGWMNGDTKLATLSDTDATDMTGTELLANTDFTSGTSPWVADQASISAGSNKLTITPNSGVNGGVYHAITTVVGKTYVYQLKVLADAAGFARMFAGTSNSITSADKSDLASKYSLGNGTHSITFVATGTTTYIWIEVGGGTQQATEFDDATVRLAEEDRSVNGNGLQVFGTVTKTPVAAGADLVAYGGFATNGSYLQQPYNSDYDFGTGDYAVSLWFKDINYGTALIGRYSTKGWLLSISSGGGGGTLVHAIYTQGFTSSGRTTVGTSTDESSKGWQQAWAIRRSGVQELWLNGELIGSTANTADLDDTSAVLTIGTYPHNTTTKAAGEFALVRISATAPSAEQIKKIYEDEKVLFQENAKATLYGTSDAVTALAYDEDTELLHAGTSAGRSVFQGLRRVDNTTRAVGAAISAVDGFVVEE